MNIIVAKQPTPVSYRNQNISKILEYSFFACLIYSLTAVPLGINVRNLAGGWLLVLAVVSILSVDWKKSAKLPMILILAMSVSFFFIQFFIHKLSLSAPYMWLFVMWILWAAVIFILSGRPGFVKRLAVVMFLIGSYLRFFVVFRMDVIVRQRLDSGSGLDNSNDYAAWMGFCALVFWLWYWNSKNKSRLFLLLVLFAVAVLFLLGTVSRGALLSLTVGILVGLRRMPIRKLVFIAIILGLSFFALQAVSNNLITNYQARLFEETGRLSRWPIAIRSFQLNPLWGYGLERVSHKGAGIDMTPHNGIILLGLASGILPALLFIVMWGLAIFHSYKDKRSAVEDIDTLPLIIYAFLEMMQSNLYFMSVWSLVALFSCFQEEPIVEPQPPLIKRKYGRYNQL